MIGSDSPTLPRNYLDMAFDELTNYELNRADCVLGPATDGGYYLIGMRGRVWPVFSDISWSGHWRARSNGLAGSSTSKVVSAVCRSGTMSISRTTGGCWRVSKFGRLRRERLHDEPRYDDAGCIWLVQQFDLDGVPGLWSKSAPRRKNVESFQDPALPHATLGKPFHRFVPWQPRSATANETVRL